MAITKLDPGITSMDMLTRGLGTGLGQGLSSGLDALANMKLEEMKQKKVRARSEEAFKSFGADPQVARALAASSPQIQLEYIKNMGKQAGTEDLASLYGFGTPQPQPQPQPTDTLQTDPSLTPGGDPTQVDPSLTPGSGALPTETGLTPGSGALPTETGLTPGAGTLPIDTSSKPDLGKTFAPKINKQDIHNRAKYLQRNEKMSLSQANQEANRELKKTMFESQERTAAITQTAELRKEVRAQAKTDRENAKKVRQMRALHKEGKLDNPFYVAALEKFGLDIPALLSPASQKFKTVTLGFLRQAKEMFGARVTNFEAAIFLKSLPSLLQSKEGRAGALDIFESLYAEGDVVERTMDSIIQKNSGFPPINLGYLLSQEMNKKRDVSANALKEIIKPFYQDELKSGEMEKTLTDMNLPSGLSDKEANKYAVGSMIPISENINDEVITQDSNGKYWVRKNGKRVPYEGKIPK